MLAPTKIQQGRDDKLIWPCNSDGSFSVKSCCTLIDNTSSANDRVSKPMFGLKGPLRKFRCFSGWQYRTKLVQELSFINGLFCLPHKLHVSFAAQIWKPQSIFSYIVTFLGVFGWKFWIGGVSNVVYRKHLTRCFCSGPKWYMANSKDQLGD
jgi:hypothetical protein